MLHTTANLDTMWSESPIVLIGNQLATSVTINFYFSPVDLTSAHRMTHYIRMPTVGLMSTISKHHQGIWKKMMDPSCLMKPLALILALLRVWGTWWLTVPPSVAAADCCVGFCSWKSQWHHISLSSQGYVGVTLEFPTSLGGVSLHTKTKDLHHILLSVSLQSGLLKYP